MFFTTMSYGQFLNNYLINSANKTIKSDVGNNVKDESCEFILKYGGTSLLHPVRNIICSKEIVENICLPACIVSGSLSLFTGTVNQIYTFTTDATTSGSINGSSVNVDPIITVNPVLILKPLNFLT